MDTIWYSAHVVGRVLRLKCLGRFMNISWLFSGVLIGMSAIKIKYKWLYEISYINC
jgi:hypothetical protein